MSINTATADSISTFNALLKEYIAAADPIETTRMEVGPFCTMLVQKSDPDAGGKTVPFPNIIGGGQGVSNTFANGQRNAKPLRANSYQLTRVPKYSFTYIDRHTLLSSDPTDSAFMAARVAEVEVSRKSLMLDLAADLYGDGSGNIGQISAGSDVTTTTITLADIKKIVYYEQDMTLEFAQNADGSTPRAIANSATITAIDYNAGTLTFGAALNSLATSVAANDYIFREGNRGSSISGLQAWMTDTAPSATLFFNVDRSTNSRNYGLFFDANALGMNVLEALTNAFGQARAKSATPTICYVHPLRFTQLSLLLQSKGMYNNQPSGGYFGFSSITLPTDYGNIPIVGDVQCPYTYGFMLDEKDWKLVSIGKIPNAEDEGGTILFRNPNADNYEVRNMLYAQLGCHRIGWQMKIKFGA